MSIIVRAIIRTIAPEIGSPSKPRRGALGRKAARAPMKTKEHMADVLANPDDYDDRTRKQAHMMKTLLSFKH
jgi:hypothetical protein